eukprot:2819264-Rhodomonas_salina.1
MQVHLYFIKKIFASRTFTCKAKFRPNCAERTKSAGRFPPSHPFPMPPKMPRKQPTIVENGVMSRGEALANWPKHCEKALPPDENPKTIISGRFISLPPHEINGPPKISFRTKIFLTKYPGTCPKGRDCYQSHFHIFITTSV